MHFDKEVEEKEGRGRGTLGRPAHPSAMPYNVAEHASLPRSTTPPPLTREPRANRTLKGPAAGGEALRIK